jgi:hypothetical protein
LISHIKGGTQIEYVQNRILRRIPEYKTDEMKSRRMKCVGNVKHMGVMKNVYRFLVGKPEGNRTLGRPRHRWNDTNKQ